MVPLICKASVVQGNTNVAIQRELFVSDPPGCGCGFMSVERMRHFLNLETVSDLVHPSQSQRLLPEMRFTCDGMITKWIFGADYNMSGNLNPELQIWRNIENETYKKINGTSIELPLTQDSRVFYEYDDFHPIPVKSGDVLGMFIPQFDSSRLRLLFENANTSSQYVVFTSNSTINEINVENTFMVSFLPLVSVEFGK